MQHENILVNTPYKSETNPQTQKSSCTENNRKQMKSATIHKKDEW